MADRLQSSASQGRARRHRQVLAVIIGLLGVVLMGLVAALAVKAFDATSSPPTK
jgi:hypothetical protein